MIYGIGSDIIKIERIQNSIKAKSEKFLNRVFTAKEVAAAPTALNKQYYAYFAKRFAGKEALSKALKTGIGSSISFQDIEILNDSNGAPLLNILKPGFNYRIHLSLSDEEEYALAFVILETI